MSEDLATLASRTPPGMAGVVSTGPTGETCRTCLFWGGNSTEPERGISGPSTYYRRWVGGIPQKQPCWRYRQLRRAQLMDEERSRGVEHNTPACSHWKPSEIEPQPETKPKGEGK